jgi:glyoxylase-like metal-dependent hydrolase (beta-lactamase superfamily II)
MARKAKRVAAKITRKVVGKKAVGHKLIPPVGGAIVRMYRIGHGDCFLLAFNGASKPIYVLIDCGYKPGSPDYINTKPDDVVADIRAVTGAHIDVAVITHEHQDHVNAITKKRFEGFTIGEVWFAWTESADDKLARRLRKKYSDRLRALVAASNRLAAADPRTDRIGDRRRGKNQCNVHRRSGRRWNVDK